MSHIAVDLKVLEVLAPGVARAAGVAEDRVLAGLLRLWHRCWSTKSDTLTRLSLAAVFGAEAIDLLVEALVDAGFLEALEQGWRVRGSERYLRLAEARSKGGKAAAGNLKRGTQRPGSPPAAAGNQPEESREASPGSTPALSPNTEHRSPRGSMSSPLSNNGSRALEDEHPHGGYDVEGHARGFIEWARDLDPALRDPGPAVSRWATDFFDKYQPADPNLIRAAFANFLLWAHGDGKVPGWGLWLSENVWLERWNRVRAERGGR